jgi:riboflavin kinase/FMN adenylyltransferase
MKAMEKKRTVIALGYFDGIHIGHGALLERAKLRAAEKNAEPAVLTFDNHPDTFVKKVNVELINSATDRIYIIKRFYGIDNVFFLHFNDATMRMPWREFIERIISAYGAVHFVVGHDFRFGFKGEGTAELLRDHCEENGLGCDIIPPVMKDGIIISSTYIRGLIAAGDMLRANEFLGHPHLITDIVRTGFRIGRTIEAPTINMQFQENVLIPRRGVYATRVLLADGEHPAVTNVGVRPTFNGSRVTVETNIIDYAGDLYGQKACVEFFDFLRPERKFESAETLMEQIRTDADTAKRLLER